MKRQRTLRDKRINAPVVSWQGMLLIIGLVVLMMFGESMIITYLQSYLPALIGSLVYYAALFVGILVISFVLVKRYMYGRSIDRIAHAARQVAQGDYSVRIAPIRRDGKKDEIEVLIEDFNHMAQELESVELLKNDFISNVSHEIKSPLAVIQNYASVLKDESLTPQERSEYADTIMDASRRLSSMVTNILRLSKLEQQAVIPQGKPYQIGEQLRRCALNYLEVWQSKWIDFEVDVQDALVRYDEDMLELVWNNLIGNAVKFTPEGGHITLTSREENERLIVVLRDDGCGMDEETQRHIFDKFYQGDSSHATRGNGLGLALVKRIMELSGGEISVESAPGKGSCFTIALPVVR